MVLNIPILENTKNLKGLDKCSRTLPLPYFFGGAMERDIILKNRL